MSMEIDERPKAPAVATGLSTKGCGHCHSCGTRLRIVLDGEEWCKPCRNYRRYQSHGWTAGDDLTTVNDCPAQMEPS
jgi:hypothetical protein